MIHRHTIAFFLLAAMFGMLLGSILNESAIVDELAHIPAGYSYATFFDYRLNPEHPPLLKAISGLFIRIVTNPHFPTEIPAWKEAINGQWDMGYSFLYHSGNDADAIIFWARLPIILLTIFFGWFLYIWANKRFGSRAALFMLTFFCFSPTMIAHSRYVTTDLGASFGFFIGIATFINVLQRPTARNAIVAGICFGIAQLLKFSLVLLLPMYSLMFIFWIMTMPTEHKQAWLQLLRIYVKKLIITGCVALATIWIIYGIFTYHYPPQRQLADTTYLLSSYGFRPAVNFDLWLVRHSLTRPLGHYLLGVLMVQQRAAGGNTAFFLGEVSNQGSRLYFPLLYLVKEPLPLHLFSLIALLYGAAQFRTWRLKRKQTGIHLTHSIRRAMHDYFIEWSCVIMIAVYWIISMKSPLNIGVRHVLPTFPFIYILVARGLASWTRSPLKEQLQKEHMIWSKIFATLFKTFPRYAITALFFFWLAINTLTTSPHFLSFYNELGGGTPNGWNIAVDSNYDWGQDLKRLADFVEKNNISTIALDYFGGGVPSYYMGNRVEQWWSLKGQPKGWFAISATFRQGTFGTLAPGFMDTSVGSYNWLKQYPPIARAGYSIFIYKLPE